MNCGYMKGSDRSLYSFTITVFVCMDRGNARESSENLTDLRPNIRAGNF
jgi:hypothetical protein